MSQRWIVSFLVFSLTPAGVPAQDKAEITLQVMKYDGLKDLVLKNRGKVVLVDLWGDFCPPCKAAFPHVVELHQKHAKEGLVVISVALDPVDDDVKGRLLKFLRAKGATFANVLLDEPGEYWQGKFNIVGPPSYFVFDRQGRWTQFKAMEDAPVDYARMDQLIVELLKEK